MSDSQRQVKVLAEQAMASLVERAKRLQLTSVSRVERLSGQEPADAVQPNAVTMKPRSKPSPIGVGAQRPIGTAGRKPNLRKFDWEPSPPPPPSPRELCLIGELRDEYRATDQLIDQMLLDAHHLNEDMLHCKQHQRDLALVHEIELEATTRSLSPLFGALSAELEGNELSELLRRCCDALARSEERPTSGNEQQEEEEEQQQQQQVVQFKGPTDFARIKEALADDLLN